MKHISEKRDISIESDTITKIDKNAEIFKFILFYKLKEQAIMQNKFTPIELTQQAIFNFENIKECLKGLYDILTITIPSNNIYLKIGQDNIEALYQNFLELMTNEAGAQEFIAKIKRAEIDLDIPLENFLK